MNAKSLQVALATALGAFVGSLIALELGGWLWWFGALAGGLVGYLTYEFKAVLKAVPKAWRTAWATITWRPSKKMRKFVGHVVLPVVIGSVYLWVDFLPVFVGLNLAILLGSQVPVGIGFVFWMIAVNAFVFVSIVALCTYLVTSPVFDVDGQLSPLALRRHLREVREMRRDANPVRIYGYVFPRMLAGGVYVLAICSGLILLASFLFAKTLFLTIHSEIRLLCGVDAAIGATIGYFSGNAIVGLLIGVVVGVLNFEIVSKRMLHCVPNGQAA